MSNEAAAETPIISVVIASKVGAPFINACLESLTRQKNAPEFETLVVDCHGEETRKMIARDFPGVRIIPMEAPQTIPELRRVGIQHAKGDIVAIIEEHCLAAENWLETIANAFENPYAAVGGPTADYNYKRLRDWVTYFTEYNTFIPPVPAGEAPFLAGNNVAFRREILMKHLPDLEHGYWEAYLYPRLKADNEIVYSEPNMVVYHIGPFNYFYYLRQRFLFSRAFAGARRMVMPWSRRLIYVAASPLLPLLLLGRMASRVWSKKCHVDKFILSIPLLIPVSGIYILGEVIGYLAGPGNSLLEVE